VDASIQLTVTQQRIRRFQDQVALLRKTEPDAASYRASSAGFLAEIDRMELEVREYLSSHPSDIADHAAALAER
jgi:hypothetical protein